MTFTTVYTVACVGMTPLDLVAAGIAVVAVVLALHADWLTRRAGRRMEEVERFRASTSSPERPGAGAAHEAGEH